MIFVVVGKNDTYRKVSRGTEDGDDLFIAAWPLRYVLNRGP